MTDHRHFERLLAEFKRVGVDPDTFSAVLAVRPEDAMRALTALPDDAGPAAFLAQLRQQGTRPPAVTPPSTPAISADRHDAGDDRQHRTGT